jgi:hypothetical protein
MIEPLPSLVLMFFLMTFIRHQIMLLLSCKRRNNNDHILSKSVTLISIDTHNGTMVHSIFLVFGRPFCIRACGCTHRTDVGVEVFQAYLTLLIYAFSLLERVENSSSAQRPVAFSSRNTHIMFFCLTFSTNAYR